MQYLHHIYLDDLGIDSFTDVPTFLWELFRVPMFSVAKGLSLLHSLQKVSAFIARNLPDRLLNKNVIQKSVLQQSW